MATPLPTSAKFPCSIKLFVVLVCIITVVLSGAFFLGTQFFFGQGITIMFIMVPMLVLALGGLLFAKANMSRPELENTFLASAFVVLVVSGCLGSTARYKDSQAAYAANNVLNKAEASLGQAPQIAAQLRPLLTRPQAVAANRELVRQIRNAEFSTSEVSQYLASAQTLGVDDSFVAQNALVRPQDKQVLFTTAIEKARAGNPVAAQWLSTNPVAPAE